MKPLPLHERAIALVITLVTLVIATILIVAFVTTMRTERRAAAAMANDERAKLISQSAVQQAMALLDKNIPQPVPLGIASGVTSPIPGIATTGSAPTNWIINPGLLTVYSGPEGSTPQYVPLFTSTNTNNSTPPTAPPSGDPVNVVNLNTPQITNTNDYPIIPTGDPVPVNWVYVTQDPTAVASATNPIIGRYAYWMDDENNKININTAYGKPTSLLKTVTDGSNSYMVRSNPLDQYTNNGFTWAASVGGTGIPTYNPDVGFDSLSGTSTPTTGTDGVIYALNADIYPGDATHLASSISANAVGNPKVTGDAGPRYYPVWHPSAINLDILPASLTNTNAIGATDLNPAGTLNRMSLADWVFDGTATTGSTASATGAQWRLFQRPDQIEQFITTGTAAAQAFYQANEFNLTAYNRAPEFNVFGKPRLLMESHISTMEDTTIPNGALGDSSKGNLSGSELEFCQTPDLDPYGPTYFHGLENTDAPNAQPAIYYPDLTATQMVADYLSLLLARKDWPGMPATSFVAKWGGNDSPVTTPSDDVGRREADQVAWNIVAMGNYASNLEGEAESGNTLSWPDDFRLVFMRTAGTANPDAAGNLSPYRPLLSSQLNVANPDPNLSLRVGKLSGKAIMPYTPKPYLNEAGLVVTAVPASSGTTGLAPSNTFYLNLSLKLELYVPRRGPPGTFWPHNCSIQFVLTHFFYTITGSGTNGTTVTATQGATGSPSYGDGGASDGYSGSYQGNAAHSNGTSAPWLGFLGGGYFIPPIASGPAIYVPIDQYPTFTTTLSGTAGTDEVDITGSNGLPTIKTKAGYGKAGQAIWACNGAAMQAVMGPPGNVVLGGTLAPVFIPSQAVGFTTASPVHIQGKARLCLCAHDTHATYEIVPVWDNVDADYKGANKAMATPTGQQDSISWDFYINLGTIPSPAPIDGQEFSSRSLEVADPRLGGNTNYNSGPLAGGAIWQLNPGASNQNYNAFADSFGGPNSNASNLDLDSFAYFDFQGGGSNHGFYANSPRPSIGFLDCVPTGMQRGIINSTLNFGPSGSNTQLPDWLMLDLVAPTFADATQPTAAPYSYLHGTMGKINLNETIYPRITNNTTGLATQRNLPLQALFKNTVADSALPSLVNNIVNHTLATGSAQGVDFGAQGQYDYIGELCEIKGVADGTLTPAGSVGGSGTKWQREALIRNLANLITTQSNTFHLWGAAQAVKVVKGSGNTNYGVYQPGDTVTVNGEKRFESVIERSVWPGVDGVPGNAHLSTSGTYDQKSTDSISPFPVSLPWAAVAISTGTFPTAVVPATTAQWAQFDGPDNPNTFRAAAKGSGTTNYAPTPGWYGTSGSSVPWPTQTTLQNALNPARVVMTYKPILFRYTSE